MKKTMMLMGALAISAAMPAYAHDTHANNDTMNEMVRYYFYKMDTDHNGYISRAEHETFSAGMFTRTDTNMDGFLTYREILAHKQTEWDDYSANYRQRSGDLYEGDKYYPYGKGSPTVTPNEPFKANRGMTDRSWRNYDVRSDQPRDERVY